MHIEHCVLSERVRSHKRLRKFEKGKLFNVQITNGGEIGSIAKHEAKCGACVHTVPHRTPQLSNIMILMENPEFSQGRINPRESRIYQINQSLSA